MIQKDTGIVFSSSSVTIPNNEHGYKKLHSDILSFSRAIGDSDICIGLESTVLYHTNIIVFLIANDFQVMMINPILTNMARIVAKVHSPKNDNIDSQTICKYMIDHLDKFSPYIYHKQMLKSLSRKRFFIVDEYRKAKLALNNLVQITFPKLKSLFICKLSVSFIAGLLIYL
jgi:transposase